MIFVGEISGSSEQYGTEVLVVLLLLLYFLFVCLALGVLSMVVFPVELNFRRIQPLGR